MSSVSTGSVTKFNPGTLLIQENEASRKLYVLRSGKVRIFKTYFGRKVTLAILGEGEIFGELSFFDAEPRSASAEALTPISVVIIDGREALQQIANLPEWVVPIFKSAFHRLREADQKITVLQSMSEYQKKVFKTDKVGTTIYQELLRFIRSLELLYNKRSSSKGPIQFEDLLKEMDEVLGARILGLRVFWKQLKDFNFVDASKIEKGEVQLDKEALNDFSSYITDELKKDPISILSHSALAILRKIVGQTQLNETESTPNFPHAEVSCSAISLSTAQLFEDGLKELVSLHLVEDLNVRGDRRLKFLPKEVFRIYHYQSIVKAFDHTVVNIE